MNFRQQLQEAYEAGYRSGLNEQDVYKRPARVSALGGQKFHAIVDSKGVIVAAGLTEKEARKKKKFGQKVMELPGAKVGQVIKKEAYEAGYRSGLNELNLQGLKNFGTDLLYGPGYTRRQQSIKDAQKMADRMKFRPGNFAALSPEEKRRLLDVFRKIADKEIKRLGNR